MDDLLTVNDVASILKLNPQTVRNWIDQGQLPAVHVGRRVRIRRADFDALIESSYVRSPTRLTSPTIWDGVIAPPMVPAESADAATDDDRR